MLEHLITKEFSLFLDKTTQFIIHFNSPDLINIRLTINDEVKIIQCRENFWFTQSITMNDTNTVKIENLTPDIPCYIKSLRVNYLDITKFAFLFTDTYTKQDNARIGAFVEDLYTPDIAIIKIDFADMFYAKILDYFIKGEIDVIQPS
jgi:hypothetical protein